jgi:acetoin utilization deacetylase AcuC-like enzyme
MYNTAFVFHPSFLLHDTGTFHPESPKRLISIIEYMNETKLNERLEFLTPEPAPFQILEIVHSKEYLQMLEKRIRRGDITLDRGDTVVCKESFDIARLAAGAVISAIDFVQQEKNRRAFCAVRPPGHHAESTRAMGFCLLNNIAIGARYAQMKYSIERIAVVDFDVHHGNGTQEIFYKDDSVFYSSLHQFPFYPGTGSESERGEGKGEGFTLNFPLPQGASESEWMQTFELSAIPEVRKFKPELILISAGFDAHQDDPLANMNLSTYSYEQMTRLLVETAEEFCEGRLVSVLEGGYNLNALARAVAAHIQIMLR